MKPPCTTVLAILLAISCTQCQSTNPRGRTAADTGAEARNLSPTSGAASVNAVSSYDDAARFLAGLPGGRNSTYAGLRKTNAWAIHQAEMDRMFASFTNGRQASIRNWRSGELGDLGRDTVFYPFGGPDFLFADAFFPNAGRYVLVGLEGADSLPSISTLENSNLSGTLANLRGSLNSVVNYSYFITKDMRNDLASTSLQGTLPPILVFLARTGHKVQSVSPVSLTSGGGTASGSGGLHIVASSPVGGSKHVYYFKENLANSNLASNPRLLQFVNNRGSHVTFLKSASYLMHGSRFSTIRNAILNDSVAVVTDPSGLPFHEFGGGSWNVNLYGNYTGTLDIFSEHHQGDLLSGYQSGRYLVKDLPFGVGYKQTSLIVARKGGQGGLAAR